MTKMMVMIVMITNTTSAVNFTQFQVNYFEVKSRILRLHGTDLRRFHVRILSNRLLAGLLVWASIEIMTVMDCEIIGYSTLNREKQSSF
jgi:hypothetical protein